MPFSNTYANNILNWAFGKGALNTHTRVYIGLCTNDPEATGGTINEISGKGYSRVLISQYNQEYPGLMNSANLRSILNGKQINWTKATADWARVNGFFLSSSPTVGETSSIFFYGALDLDSDVKAAGGLLVEAGAVALFDPESLKIEFPEDDAVAGTETRTALLEPTDCNFVLDSGSSSQYIYTHSGLFGLTAGKKYAFVFELGGTTLEYVLDAADSSGSVVSGDPGVINDSITYAPFVVMDTNEGGMIIFKYAAGGASALTATVAIYEVA